MDLYSHYPFWLLAQGIVKTYPSLSSDVHADVAIIGAGVSGALTAWHLCKAGVKVVMADRRHAGMGSTVATTGLLQYEIDTPLHELVKKTGEKNAVRSYLLCRQSIYDLQAICKKLPQQTGFALRPSFQYASYKRDVRSLEKEYLLRKKAGIPLQWLQAKDIKDTFGFFKHAGLLSEDGAEVNAYALTHALLADCRQHGVQVYDHTTVNEIHYHKKGVELVTGEGCKIKARQLVIACGYESQQYIPHKVASVYSTYSIVSEPAGSSPWYKSCLIWETAMPYLYLRATGDNRILIGGKDDAFSGSLKRDAALPKKVKALEHAFQKLFPQLPFKTDFKWAGAFASTKDGLPYIGGIPQRPHTYFALGFGGNGITFSVLAAQIITDLITGKSNDNASLFDFKR